MASKDVTDQIETVQPPPQHESGRKAIAFESPLDHVDELNAAAHLNLTWRSWVVVFVNCFANFAQIYVVIAAGTVITFIARDLGDATHAGWIIQCPLLMQSVLSPIVGRIGDVYSRKWVAAIPPFVAFVGAVISARATSMSMLIGGGVLIGTTLSTVAIVHAIPSEVLPLKLRVVANGLGYMGGSFAALVGTLGSGALTNTNPGGWRSIFWIQAAFHLATGIGLVVFYNPVKKSDYGRLSAKEFFWLCDPIGSFLFAGATCILLLAFDWAGDVYEWDDARVISTMTIGFVLLVSFGVYEWKGRSDGLMAHVFFKGSPNFALSMFSFAVEGWLFYSAVNSVVPQIILRLGFENTAWRIGIRQLTFNVTAIVATLPIMWYATKYKDPKTPLLITFIIFLAATICYTVITPNMKNAQIGFGIMVGFGQAGPLALIITLIQFTAPHAYLSTGTGLAYSARAMGGAFGSAVLGAITNGKLKSYPAAIEKAAVESGLSQDFVPALVKALQRGIPLSTIPGVTPEISARLVDVSHWEYAGAYNMAWASIIPFVVLAIVATWFLKGVKQLMTEKVESTVEKDKLPDVEVKASEPEAKD